MNDIPCILNTYSRRDTLDYSRPVIYENGAVKRVMFDGGYATFDANGVPGWHYFLCDHAGSVRVVADMWGRAEQINHYYPYGLTFADAGKAPDHQPFKFGGKELDAMYGLNLHDFHARLQIPDLGRFDRPDSLCEEYPHLSPYIFCGNDPINNTDPTGNQFLGVPSPLLGTNPIWMLSNKPIIENTPNLTRPTVETIPRVGTKTELHHIIPRQLKNEPVVRQAIKDGFHFEGDGNKIAVEKFVKATGKGQHANHPNYNTQVARQLARHNPSKDNAVEFIEKTISVLKNTIKSNPNTKINDLNIDFNGLFDLNIITIPKTIPQDNTIVNKNIIPYEEEILRHGLFD